MLARLGHRFLAGLAVVLGVVAGLLKERAGRGG